MTENKRLSELAADIFGRLDPMDQIEILRAMDQILATYPRKAKIIDLRGFNHDIKV